MDVVCFRSQHESHDYSSDSYSYYIPELELIIKKNSSIDFHSDRNGEKYEGVMILQNEESLGYAEKIAMGCIPNENYNKYSLIKIIEINKEAINKIVSDIKLRKEIGPRIKSGLNLLYKQAFSQ